MRARRRSCAGAGRAPPPSPRPWAGPPPRPPPVRWIVLAELVGAPVGVPEDLDENPGSPSGRLLPYVVVPDDHRPEVLVLERRRRLSLVDQDCNSIVVEGLLWAPSHGEKWATFGPEQSYSSGGKRAGMLEKHVRRERQPLWYCPRDLCPHPGATVGPRRGSVVTVERTGDLRFRPAPVPLGVPLGSGILPRRGHRHGGRGRAPRCAVTCGRGRSRCPGFGRCIGCGVCGPCLAGQLARPWLVRLCRTPVPELPRGGQAEAMAPPFARGSPPAFLYLLRGGVRRGGRPAHRRVADPVPLPLVHVSPSVPVLAAAVIGSRARGHDGPAVRVVLFFWVSRPTWCSTRCPSRSLPSCGSGPAGTCRRRAMPLFGAGDGGHRRAGCAELVIEAVGADATALRRRAGLCGQRRHGVDRRGSTCPWISRSRRGSSS